MNHQLERAAVAQSHGGEVAPERNECGGLVDGIAETPVVWRTLDQLVDERTGIANERSGVTGRN